MEREREDLRDKKVDLEVGGGENSEDGRETRDERKLWREMRRSRAMERKQETNR